MSTTWKWIIGILVVTGLGWMILKKNRGGKDIEKVTVEKVSRRTIDETVSTSGKIYPETEIRVSPDYSGQITELRVAEGDTVKKGQVLARVSDRGNIESSIDGIVLSLKVKKGESVTGNSFSIGTEVMTIADMSLLEVRVEVGEIDIVKINTGDSADVIVDAYSPRIFKGTVTRIANNTKTAGPGNMGGTGDITNYEVRIRLDSSSYRDFKGKNFPFRPGMNASAEIRTRKVENVLAVPIGAVSSRVRNSELSMDDQKRSDEQKEEENGSGTSSRDQLEEVVFVLQKDNTVKKQVVKTGIQDMNYIEILQGLVDTDEVVTGPYSAISRNLRSGSKVKPVAKDKLFEQ